MEKKYKEASPIWYLIMGIFFLLGFVHFMKPTISYITSPKIKCEVKSYDGLYDVFNDDDRAIVIQSYDVKELESNFVYHNIKMYTYMLSSFEEPVYAIGDIIECAEIDGELVNYTDDWLFSGKLFGMGSLFVAIILFGMYIYERRSKHKINLSKD